MLVFSVIITGMSLPPVPLLPPSLGSSQPSVRKDLSVISRLFTRHRVPTDGRASRSPPSWNPALKAYCSIICLVHLIEEVRRHATCECVRCDKRRQYPLGSKRVAASSPGPRPGCY